MSKRIFDLLGVPPNEVEDVRCLLRRNKIRFYDTPSGDYLDGAALWVASETEYTRARILIGDYQRGLAQRSRERKHLSPNKSKFVNIGLKIRRDVPFFLFAILVVLILVFMLVFGVGRR